MNLGLSISLALLAVAVSGCSIGIDHTERTPLYESGKRALEQSDSDQLRSEAGALWARLPKDTSRVPRRHWPSSFKAFKPKLVEYDFGGIYIVTKNSRYETVGIYVVVREDYVPDEHLGAGYAELENDIYWAERSR